LKGCLIQCVFLPSIDPLTDRLPYSMSSFLFPAVITLSPFDMEAVSDLLLYAARLTTKIPAFGCTFDVPPPTNLKMQIYITCL